MSTSDPAALSPAQASARDLLCSAIEWASTSSHATLRFTSEQSLQHALREAPRPLGTLLAVAWQTTRPHYHGPRQVRCPAALLSSPSRTLFALAGAVCLISIALLTLAPGERLAVYQTPRSPHLRLHHYPTRRA